MSKYTAEEKSEAIARLQSYAPAGARVSTILRHVSQSGMSRCISVVVVHDGEIVDLDWFVARAGLFSTHSTKGGLKVSGTGMDMGFHVVYELSRLIHGDGYALKQSWL